MLPAQAAAAPPQSGWEPPWPPFAGTGRNHRCAPDPTPAQDRIPLDLLNAALRGARHPQAAAPAMPDDSGAVPRARPLLVIGAGGVLGAALLEQALPAGRFLRVWAVTTKPLEVAVRGLHTLPAAQLPGILAGQSRTAGPEPAPGDRQAPPWEDAADAVAVVVFERQRLRSQRDSAFLAPAVEDLLPLAQGLRRQGLRHLVVVVPQAPALMPQALAHGLATLDEAAVAALGFDHLVFCRATQGAVATPVQGALPRLAAWWLSQLRWMVPQQEQPLRAASLATCLVALLRELARSPPGSRVLGPQTLWALGQDAAQLNLATERWLQGVEPAAVTRQRPRGSAVP